jgi:WD40 repeat protein
MIPETHSDKARHSNGQQRSKHVCVSLVNVATVCCCSPINQVITHTVVTPVTDFVITASMDGNLKFWKKTRGGIEFIKTFKAHTKPFTSLSVNPTGTRLCSTAADPAVKIFDVTSFDMINMLKVGRLVRTL